MRYYGNKTKLLSFIERAVKDTGINGNSNFVDLFAGTCSVGKHFKQLGYTVVSNDNLEFSYALSKSYIELNKPPKFAKLRKHLELKNQTVFGYLNNIEEFNSGFIHQNYAPAGGRQYFTNENALRIDTFRKLLHDWKQENVIDESEFYYLLTSLLKAINLVSNVSGTYAAYLKNWDKRALKQLRLEPFEIIHSKNQNKAYRNDANEIIQNLTPDILYLDPPYNSRQYASNYFILELVAEGWFEKQPKIYGETGMRDYESQKSKSFCETGLPLAQ
jgi:adenine-specific DNA-methyltransferase